MAIAAILITLALAASCALAFNPGKYGMTSAEQEQNQIPE